MKPFQITVQYLEDAPDLAGLDPSAVIDRLRAAADRLPISHLLIGWHLPPRLLEACRKEADRLGMRFLRWHPLLTGDDAWHPDASCRVMGASGRRVPAYRRKAGFAFACPNHPGVHEQLTRRLEILAREGMVQGFFLDRIRFPSPAVNPLHSLGCFCRHCREKAADEGLDLELVRRTVSHLDQKTEGRLGLVQVLLGASELVLPEKDADVLQSFLDFRSRSITSLVTALAAMLQSSGIEVGLDCFSPSLGRMVGQDLHALGEHADWVKVMTYAHTRAPAGIPFELLGLIQYLHAAGLALSEIMKAIRKAAGLPLPSTSMALEMQGLSSSALEGEVKRAVKNCPVPVLAGMELMEIKGVVELEDDQIRTDLAAVRRAGAEGLAVSWDLRGIPLERLVLLSRSLGMKQP